MHIKETPEQREQRGRDFIKAFSESGDNWDEVDAIVFEAILEVMESGHEKFGVAPRVPHAISTMLVTMCHAVGGQLQALEPSALACFEIMKGIIQQTEERCEESIATLRAMQMLDEVGADVTAIKH